MTEFVRQNEIVAAAADHQRAALVLRRLDQHDAGVAAVPLPDEHDDIRPDPIANAVDSIHVAVRLVLQANGVGAATRLVVVHPLDRDGVHPQVDAAVRVHRVGARDHRLDLGRHARVAVPVRSRLVGVEERDVEDRLGRRGRRQVQPADSVPERTFQVASGRGIRERRRMDAPGIRVERAVVLGGALEGLDKNLAHLNVAPTEGPNLVRAERLAGYAQGSRQDVAVDRQGQAAERLPERAAGQGVAPGEGAGHVLHHHRDRFVLEEVEPQKGSRSGRVRRAGGNGVATERRKPRDFVPCAFKLGQVDRHDPAAQDVKATGQIGGDPHRRRTEQLGRPRSEPGRQEKGEQRDQRRGRAAITAADRHRETLSCRRRPAPASPVHSDTPSRHPSPCR